MWEKGTKGSGRGWRNSFNTWGSGDNLGMLDFHGEGCKGMEKDVCAYNVILMEDG